jgi:replicative DNA helicase
VAKNRMGTTGTATVAFKGHLAHACDMNTTN